MAPFTRTRLGQIAPAIRLWSHKYAPLGEPLVEGGNPEPALSRLIDGLTPADSGVCLILPEMMIDGPVAAAVRAIAERDGRPLAVLNAHSRAMLVRGSASKVLRAGLPTRRRKELARQMRRLSDLGPLAVETIVEAGQVRVHFEEFLTLEMAGWKGRRGTALASSPASAAFAREAISNLAAVGAVRIESLRVGDRPIAVLVGLIGGATAYTWKTAYDEAFARFSPGAEIMLEAPVHFFSDAAVERIDSCATANHSMIDRLWPGRLEMGSIVLGPPRRRALHRIALASARTHLAARAHARRLRERLH